MYNPSYTLRPEPMVKKKRKPTYFRINVFAAMGPTPTTSVSHKFGVDDSVRACIGIVLHHVRDSWRNATEGQSTGLPEGNTEDHYLMTVATEDGEPAHDRAFDPNEGLRQQLKGLFPDSLAVYEDPAVIQRRQEAELQAKVTLEHIHEREKQREVMLQRRAENVKLIEEKRAAQELQRLMHSQRKDRELMAALERRKEAVPPPKLSKQEQQYLHKTKLQAAKLFQRRRMNERKLMYAHDLESQAYMQCQESWNRLCEEEAAKKELQEAEAAAALQQEQAQRQQEKELRRKPIQRALEAILDESIALQVKYAQTAEAARSHEAEQFLVEQSLFQSEEANRLKHDKRRALVAMRKSNKLTEPAGPGDADLRNSWPMAGSKDRSSQPRSASSLAAAQPQVATGARSNSSLGLVPPLPKDGPIYTFQLRFPPLHRLPPVALQEGSLVEFGSTQRFVRYNQCDDD